MAQVHSHPARDTVVISEGDQDDRTHDHVERSSGAGLMVLAIIILLLIMFGLMGNPFTSGGGGDTRDPGVQESSNVGQ